MKRAAALILCIVYLAFAFGGLGTEPSLTDSVCNFIPAALENDETGKNTADETVTTGHIGKSNLLHKIHKHLATTAKVKLPRPGFITTSFIAFTPENRSINSDHLRTGTPLWAPSTLYLKNCVFLI